MRLDEIQDICDQYFFETNIYTKNGSTIDIEILTPKEMIVNCTYGCVNGNDFFDYKFTLYFKMNRNKFVGCYAPLTFRKI